VLFRFIPRKTRTQADEDKIRKYVKWQEAKDKEIEQNKTTIILNIIMAYIKFRDGLFNRWIYITIFFSSLLLVLFATLYPYDFDFKETVNSLWHIFLILEQGKSDTLDVLKNVLLFMPLGFSLACLMQNRRHIGLVMFAVILLVCFGLSYTIEIIQIFLPSRFASLIDILSNVAGGILGFLCFLLLESKVKVIDNTSAFMKRNLQLSFLGYAVFAILISISLQHFSSLNNWDRTYPILLGNERTGDRPWQGYISELYIANRAISGTEVAQIISKKKTVDLIGESLIASYQLTGSGNYHDDGGNLPDLIWRGEPRDVQQRKGVFLDSNHWLETAASAEYLTQRIVGTSQFTLGMTVATSDTKQIGPARIISLSEDPGHRNFTLGQQGSDLVFRLRTPVTGENGTNPFLVAPDVFATKNLHNLIVTYDGLNLLLYVDGKRSSNSLKLNPGIILFSSLFRQYTYYAIGYKAMHYVYYALVFIPLGILMTLTVKIMRSRFFIKVIIICGYIMLPPIILEGILVIVSGRVVSMDNLLISMIFTISPMVFLRYVIPRIL
jgi:glycopeptide antibiotics resistance protein